MKFSLKKIFVPHESNGHHPHLLHTAGLLSLAGIAAAVFGIFFLVSAALPSLALRSGALSDYLASVLPSVLVDLANSDRAASGLASLAPNPLLQQAAQDKADDMAALGYFAHTSPQGFTPWHWFDVVGYDYSYAGENLAANFNDSNDVNTAWMNSPEHRANILSGDYTEIGIATADGTYQGHPTIFVVEEFARPAVVAAGVSAPASVSAVSGISTAPAAAPVIRPVAAPPRTIASSTITSPNGQTQTFVAVAAANAPAVQGASSTRIDPDSYGYAGLFAHIITNPDDILQVVYLVMAVMILIVLALTVAKEAGRKHVRHVLAAAGLLVIIVALLYVYKDFVISAILIA